MQVIYDARWVPVDGKFDGVGRYTCELGNALAARDDLDIMWLIYDTRQLAVLTQKPYIIGNNPNNLWAELTTLPRILTREHPDVVYAPFFLTALARGSYRLIVTIHDTIYFHYRTPPQWLAWYVRLGWWSFHLSKAPMRWLLNRADAVATVSDTALRELQAWHMIKRPLFAVKNAVSSKFRALESQTNHAASHIVVHHGAVTPYKNVELIIDALPLVPEVEFHMLGKVPASRLPSLEKRIAARGVSERVVIHNGVSDSELLDMLMRCRCLISPSRIEGFGLPVIEAQLSGVPVICSDTPIYHEIAGDSVLYTGVDDPKTCAQHIQDLANPETSQRLITAGRQNVARYSWQASADVASKMCHKIVAHDL